MTIFYPDLSHYDLDRGVSVQPGTVAVLAKASHGTLFVDSGYATLRGQAAAVGALFGAYHWLNHGNGTGQGRYCHAQVGSTPVMVDAEDMDGNSGYSGPLTVGDIAEFVTGLRAAGGVCHLVYLPRWYWQGHMGSPDLAPLARLGVAIVSSNYTTYSDSGPGWSSYGGVTPAVWQYTDKQPYSGSYCDFNAYRGTVEQFRALITGGQHDMATLLAKTAADATVYIGDGLHYRPLSIPDSLAKLASVRSGDIMVFPSLAALEDVMGKPASDAPAVGAPTQDQVDTAVAKALADPNIQDGIAARIAAHVQIKPV